MTSHEIISADVSDICGWERTIANICEEWCGCGARIRTGGWRNQNSVVSDYYQRAFRKSREFDINPFNELLDISERRNTHRVFATKPPPPLPVQVWSARADRTPQQQDRPSSATQLRPEIRTSEQTVKSAARQLINPIFSGLSALFH